MERHPGTPHTPEMSSGSFARDRLDLRALELSIGALSQLQVSLSVYFLDSGGGHTGIPVRTPDDLQWSVALRIVQMVLAELASRKGNGCVSVGNSQSQLRGGSYLASSGLGASATTKRC